MGLLYIMPVSLEEKDRVETEKDKIILKSYGLPLVFWGYAFAILTTLFFLYLAIRAPIESALASNDEINKFLAWSVLALFIFLALTCLGALFYEKTLKKVGSEIEFIYKIIWIPFWRKKIQLKSPQSFEVRHHLESPNMARLQGQVSTRAFQNQGYYQLFAENTQGELILVDRHSRKADMKRIQNLLSSS